MSNPAAMETSPSQEANATEEGGKRPASGAAGPPSKRPRYEGKAFTELTIAELENVVREVTELKKQVSSRDAEIAQLRESVQNRAALAKEVKALEGELAAKQKEAGKLQSAVREQDEDVSTQADRVKRALRQQISNQMYYHPGMRELLQGPGREIVAFAPNVSMEVLKALGAEHGTKSKHADCFFGSLPTKSPSNGVKLALVRSITLKYVRASCELRLDGTYRIQGEGGKNKGPTKQAKKAPKKRSSKGGGAKAAEGGEDGEGEGDEDEEEDGEDDGDAEGEGNLEAEPEAEAEATGAEPEVPATRS